MIAKKYKISAHYEFLQIRHKLWKFQFVVISLACIMGFPTTILQKEVEKLQYKMDQGEGDQTAYIDKLTKYLFYLFFSGIFKDHRREYQNYFYFTFMILFSALIIER
jgi:hypothetical protein